MSLSRPLELEKTLTQPERRLDAAAVIDVLLIALFMSMLGSRFVFAPGLTVDIELDLPRSEQKMLSGVQTDAVLTVAVLTAKQDNMHIFNGSIYTLENLEGVFDDYHSSIQKKNNTVLLVKADKRITMETLLKITDFARAAGFSKIQLAATSKIEVTEPLPY